MNQAAKLLKDKGITISNLNSNKIMDRDGQLIIIINDKIEKKTHPGTFDNL